jgi:hypothetical protein
MSLFDTYETNAEKESEGVEVPMPEATNKDGSVPTFILASTSRANQKYAKALEKATKPFRRNMDAMSTEVGNQLYQEVFIKTVLKGWRNVQTKNGEEITFTAANAKQLFETLPRLYDQLNEKASSIELFQDAQREEEAKNS